MLKQHSFSNPFSGIKEKFQKSGRSNSAPGAYDIYIDRLIHISLCFCFSSRFLSFFCGSNLFFHKNSTECLTWLDLTFTFVLIFCAEQSFFVSICCPSPSECMQVFSFCKRLGATRETVYLQVATFCTNIQHHSFNYSTMAVNFAWFLTTKPYHMHAVK